MYSILLVEDEKVELETLKNFVNWEKCGIDRVFTARGARSALECINSQSPDIMITDIQMPGMSGIDLAKIVREEGHDCRIVFLTGYDRFDYAKSAISLHADDYLLKPFLVEELESLVTRIVNEIRAEQRKKEIGNLARGHFLEDMCKGKIENPAELAGVYFKEQTDHLYFHLMAVFNYTEESSQQISRMPVLYHSFPMDDMLVLILPASLSSAVLAERLHQTYSGQGLQYVIFRHSIVFAQLAEAVKELQKCREDVFYENSGCILPVENHQERKKYSDRMEGSTQKSDLLQTIYRGQTESASAKLSEMLDSFCDMDSEGCRQNAFGLFGYLHNQLDKRDEADGEAQVPNILHALNYSVMKESFLQYIRQCCRACADRNENRLSFFVRHFVELHYREDCTVEEMAEEVRLSPNYLRKCFKEETGITILEYLTDYRLNKAASLLKDPSLKVKEVSVAVGYENISYFTQLFAKKYGATPNEFRRNQI